jgi:nickel-dependent lactate racemase
MANFQIPYGHSSKTISLPDELQVDFLSPPKTPASRNPLLLVTQAISSPLGGKTLADFKNVSSVAIAINDKTRPVPHKYLLPPLLHQLEELGLESGQIKLIIATGAHPIMPPDDYPLVIPPRILERYRVLCHDASNEDNLIFLDHTSRGTPVFINKDFLLADLKLVVGNIEPHQFQGFSGGVKSAAIGLAGKATITQNHSMMSDPNAHLGLFEENPVRQDVEEIGRLIGVDFAINAILNESKEIIHVVAGDPLLVMETGLPLARQACQISVESNFDLIIASPGGHPKDINLYQAQKALAHACLITRPGGAIILAAACPDGAGSQNYETWVRGMSSLDQVISRFMVEGFRIGPHKAYQIARDATFAKVWLHSDMHPEYVRSLLLEPIDDLQLAIETILKTLPRTSRIAILPRASSTIPQQTK